jgi:hypothetical protein
MIDRMFRTSKKGLCELCEKRIAAHRAKFTTQFVESVVSPPFDEERLSSANLQKKVCEECVKELSNCKNITNLVVEPL